VRLAKGALDDLSFWHWAFTAPEASAYLTAEPQMVQGLPDASVFLVSTLLTKEPGLFSVIQRLQAY